MIRRFFNPLIFTLAGLLASSLWLRADTTDTASFNASVLESNVAYVRIGQVEKNLIFDISNAQHSLTTTNKIIGTILDLRFADGSDPAAAKAAANLFTTKKQPLAILVNSQTRGAAATLAASLREARDGLILGSAAAGLKPDITVPVSADAESVFLKNPYATVLNETNTIAGSGTNNFVPFIDHTSEADLVRAKIKDGEEDEDFQPARPSEPQKPIIHDPVLARAVDLIKALAVLRQAHR
jgi:hypothetical protein